MKNCKSQKTRKIIVLLIEKGYMQFSTENIRNYFQARKQMDFPNFFDWEMLYEQKKIYSLEFVQRQ